MNVDGSTVSLKKLNLSAYEEKAPCDSSKVDTAPKITAPIEQRSSTAREEKPSYESVNGKVSTGPPIDESGLAVQTTGDFADHAMAQDRLQLLHSKDIGDGESSSSDRERKRSDGSLGMGEITRVHSSDASAVRKTGTGEAESRSGGASMKPKPATASATDLPVGWEQLHDSDGNPTFTSSLRALSHG